MQSIVEFLVNTSSNVKKQKYEFTPKTNKELRLAIRELLSKHRTDFNCIDVSNVSDFSYIFKGVDMKDIDISEWDVHNAESFNHAFDGASNINPDNFTLWNVVNASEFKFMFANCKNLKIDLSKWNTIDAHDMGWMFSNSDFNGDISNWNVSAVTNFMCMFANNDKFNCDLSKWSLDSAENIASMFKNAKSFNQNIDSWTLTKNVSMNKGAFENCPTSPSWFNDNI